MTTEIDDSLTKYDPVKAEIAKIKERNAKVVFLYHTPEGNKDARSHIFQMRKTKAEIERTRVALKADALEYGRKVDSAAKTMMAEIDDMIAVHQKPLDEIELKAQRDKAEAERLEQARKDAEAAAERAKVEQAAAVERARQEEIQRQKDAAEVERNRRAEAEAAESRRMKQAKHRNAVIKEVASSLITVVTHLLDEDAKSLATAMLDGNIDRVRVNTAEMAAA